MLSNNETDVFNGSQLKSPKKRFQTAVNLKFKGFW